MEADLLYVTQQMIRGEHNATFFRGTIETITGNTATVIRNGQTVAEGPYATLASYTPVHDHEVLVIDLSGGGTVAGIIVGRILR